MALGKVLVLNLLPVITMISLTACSTVSWHQYLTESESDEEFLSIQSLADSKIQESGVSIKNQNVNLQGSLSTFISASASTFGSAKENDHNVEKGIGESVRVIRSGYVEEPGNRLKVRDYLEASRANLESVSVKLPTIIEPQKYSVLRGWYTAPVDPARDLRVRKEHAEKIRGKAVPLRIR